jgi:hypothetical protein
MMKARNCQGRLRSLILLLMVACITACSSVTIRPDGGNRDSAAPSYLDSKPFYLVGLIGDHKVDVNEVCEGADVSQMQTVMTSSDYLLGIATLFIYSPRTVKVWCEE